MDSEWRYYSFKFVGTSRTDDLSKSSIEKAEARAQKEAEMKFFQHLFGINELEAFIVDELGRPVTQE